MLVGEIYRKSLRRVQNTTSTNIPVISDSLSSESLQQGQENASIGKIVTIMSIDTERIRDVSI